MELSARSRQRRPVPQGGRTKARRALLLAVAAACVSACSVSSPLPRGVQAYSVIPDRPPPGLLERYPLGPNDTISVRVFQEPELSSESLRIDPAGNVVLPLLGPVRAQGYSPAELTQRVQQALKRYLHHPQVAITLVESGQTVTVEGAVKKPGVFPIRGRSSLVDALALAGSPLHIAANDQIFVFRDMNGRRAGARFDIRRIRAGIDPDPVLLPGDQVVVGFSAVKEAWREYLGAPIFNVFRIL